MKRRDFLVGAGLSGVAPGLVRAASLVPCPAPTAHTATGPSVTTTCSPITAQSDWLTRISGPRVVWYNGFASAAEVNLYRWAGGVGNDPTASSPDASYMQWNASGGPGGLAHLSIYRPAAHEPNVFWWRPLSAHTAATNGLGVNDPAAGGTVALRTWSPPGTDNAELASWPYGWYTQNSSIAQDGTDFWVQLRVKMDPNASTSGHTINCKLFELNLAGNTYWNNTLVTVLNGSYGGGTNYNRIYTADGSALWSYQSAKWEGPSTEVGVSDPRVAGVAGNADYFDDVGGATWNPPTAYCDISNGADGGGKVANCWAYSGGWDTLLYHVTPGPVALTGPHGGTVCAIQVYAAHQGETVYTKIRDQTFELQSWGATGKEGWQAIYLTVYCNNTNQPADVTSRFAQIIFAKGDGTNNIPIPCPQV